MKDFEEEIVDNDEISNTVNEIKIIIKEGMYKNYSIKILKKDYPDKIREIEEASPNYMGENDLKFKKKISDKWKCLDKKLASLHEYFNSSHDYQNSVDKLKKEYFFSKLKNKCPSDEERERTKELFKRFNLNKGEELTYLYLKSDVFLLTCVFENFINVSANEFGIIPLYCVSLPGYLCQCGLKYTGINLQTLQDEDLTPTLENNISGGMSSVMGDR